MSIHYDLLPFQTAFTPPSTASISQVCAKMGPVRFFIVLLAVFLALSNARPTKDGEITDRIMREKVDPSRIAGTRDAVDFMPR